MEKNEFFECIESCQECANFCRYCADACLQEKEIGTLRNCIKLDLECALICEMAAQMMGSNSELSEEVCELCAEACRRCADECDKHDHMSHCKECSVACRSCAEICQQIAEHA